MFLEVYLLVPCTDGVAINAVHIFKIREHPNEIDISIDTEQFHHIHTASMKEPGMVSWEVYEKIS